ncbi:DUF2797 domain-containing protein [Arthrobacter cryoconiti]|uniref:DUF2797 domain-containing protein n=1 Tax=Arthrobacter cryoconiti TaxID=748907 RepID=A0ABV8QYY6_9MICC|nr:DUF2797 domain-containing protein [Arthrobacter cryoconiti]MCC9069927.1 DUF2797 domain-containing protein [Arthrobacter cryoconiti]
MSALLTELAGGLVRGVSWSLEGPVLSLITVDGGAKLPLSAGQWLRFSVESGPAVAPRYCLGHMQVKGPTDSVHIPCPTGAAAERGYQCGRCFARDDFRFMHDFHRSGLGPAGLKAYLAQPHWLYIATFADGTTKVGTASERSKWSRLADQGAVVAQYVAHARDGSVVRVLEDAVSAQLGLTQFVRGSAKFAALKNPQPTAELAVGNRKIADVVRNFLKEQFTEGFETVGESWLRPEFADAVTGTLPRIAYPLALDAGEHGLRLDALLGGYALVGVDDSESKFLLDLAALKGHKIRFGAHTTQLPAVQELLF